ncbi:MAG TPA: hypothetical protein VK881_03690 [bacterium]|nr:hypothetical protein [bacterium]
MRRLLVALFLLTIMFWAFPRFAYADCTPQSCDQYGRNHDNGRGNAPAAGEPTGGSDGSSGEMNGNHEEHDGEEEHGEGKSHDGVHGEGHEHHGDHEHGHSGDHDHDGGHPGHD